MTEIIWKSFVFLYTYSTFNSTTMLENAERVADTLMKNWFQKCAVGEICNLSYMMHRTLPLDDSAVTGASKNTLYFHFLNNSSIHEHLYNTKEVWLISPFQFRYLCIKKLSRR